MSAKVRMIPIPILYCHRGRDEGSRDSMILLCHSFPLSLAVF